MYGKCFNSIVAVTHVYQSAPYIQTVHCMAVIMFFPCTTIPSSVHVRNAMVNM